MEYTQDYTQSPELSPRLDMCSSCSSIDPSVLVMVMSMLSSCIFVTGWKNSSCDPISV